MKKNKCSKFPNVQVIIVNWNKKRDVLSLLGQLEDINYPNDKLSVLLVDNNSIDGTVQSVAEAYPQVHLVRHRENRGGAGGFNSGMRWAFENNPDAAYFWLLDNDVVVDKNALISLVNVLDTNPRAAICGSKIMNIDHRDEIIEIGAFIDYRVGDIKKNAPNSDGLNGSETVYKVDYVAACSLLARASHVSKMGVMREALFIYWDDMEWGARFRKAGYDVLATSESTVYHPNWIERTGDYSLVWRTYYRVRNSLWFFNNYCDGIKKRFLLGRMIIRYMTWAINASATTRIALSRSLVNGVFHFLIGRFGIKKFTPPFTDIEKLVGQRTNKILPVFVPDSEASDNAMAFMQQLVKKRNGIKIAAIVPEAVKDKWKYTCGKKELIFFKRNQRGSIILSDRYKILQFLKELDVWHVIVSSIRPPHEASIWGRSVSIVNFDSGVTLSIERFCFKTLISILIQTPVFLFRAMLFPPAKNVSGT